MVKCGFYSAFKTIDDMAFTLFGVCELGRFKSLKELKYELVIGIWFWYIEVTYTKGIED